MFLMDVNVLVYAHREDTPEHSVYREWLESTVKETLINSANERKHEAHGTQQPRHINKIGEDASTAQRSGSLVQSINQRFLNCWNDKLMAIQRFVGKPEPQFIQ